MMFTGITPIHNFNGVWVKREDLAHWDSLEHPSGSKVRQYLDMAHRACTGEGYPPCLVGCSANSAQQIYVASTAKRLNTKGVIFTAKRKEQTDATKYAGYMGAELNELKPAYLSYIRMQARGYAAKLGRYVQWDQRGAILDAAKQVVDLPLVIRRIVVPTGSGLTAAGVLLGLSQGYQDRELPVVVAVATSPMASREKIIKLAKSVVNQKIPWAKLEVIGPFTAYDNPAIAQLPDGTPLDPFYAAKAWKHVREGDLFWSPGLRPVMAMPEMCRNKFKDWKGPELLDPHAIDTSNQK